MANSSLLIGNAAFCCIFALKDGRISGDDVAVDNLVGWELDEDGNLCRGLGNLLLLMALCNIGNIQPGLRHQRTRTPKQTAFISLKMQPVHKRDL